MLRNKEWQSIPGAFGAKIYPIINKPSLTNSNSFIIQTDETIIVIDTGADPHQMSHIKEATRQLVADRDRPVLVLLTHAHTDHFLQAFADQEFMGMAKVRVAVQEKGAQPIEGKDRKKTIADIFGWELPDAVIHMALLSEEDRENPGEKMVDLGEGIIVRTMVEEINTGYGAPFYKQVLSIGSHDVAEVFPIPGHSPDSVSIAIGDLLFVGDFFFALDYLVAGLVGWDPEEMKVSIKRMLWMTEHRGIKIFCSGHGNPLPQGEAVTRLNKMAEKIDSLTGLQELNPEHMVQSSEYALELLEELNDTMAVIAGRLYTLAYYLDYLGESCRAEKYSAVIDSDRIDDLLSEYDDFAQRFVSGDIKNLVLVKKAGHLIGKIKQTFSLKDSEKVIDSLLLARVERSLADFIRITGGMPLEGPTELVDLDQLIGDLLEEIKDTPYNNDDILAVLEDEEQFLDELVSRIAFQPVFKNVRLNFVPHGRLPSVKIQKDRFCDALAGILEQIAAIGVEEICLVSGISDGVEIRITAPGGIPEDALNKKERCLYGRKVKILGGEMKIEEDGEGNAFVLRFPF